ncbi:MAG: hypothetical protein R3A44_43005 [Caldilineaceae bacterium]
MSEMGLEPVAHVGGGISAWKKAGGPVETIAGEPWVEASKE